MKALQGISAYLIIFFLGITTYFVVKSFVQSHDESSPKNLGKVQRGVFTQRITIAGTVVPRRKTVITPPYSGFVNNLQVKIGDQVQEGDPLLTVQQYLQERNSFPMRAPFKGTVVQVHVTGGEYVQVGSGNSANGEQQNALLRMDDLTKLYVESQVPELDISKIEIGQDVIIRVSALQDRTYKGIVREKFMAAREQKDWERNRVEFPVRVEIMDFDKKVKPGMSVIADIIAGEKENVLMLRQEYVQIDGEQYYVELENGQRRNIQVGWQNDEYFEVTDGLNQGDKVRPANFLAISH